MQVRFYDPEAGWEGWGVFGPNDVHKQYAISLITPAYTGPPPATSRRVLVELVKPSEETNSEPSQFWYLNNSSGGLADNTGQGRKERDGNIDFSSLVSCQDSKLIRSTTLAGSTQLMVEEDRKAYRRLSVR